jgi:hypothetical protein
MYSLLFSIDRILIYAMFFLFLLFLLERGRKATALRTPTKQKTSNEYASPSGQPSTQSTSGRGDTQDNII